MTVKEKGIEWTISIQWKMGLRKKGVKDEMIDRRNFKKEGKKDIGQEIEE